MEIKHISASVDATVVDIIKSISEKEEKLFEIVINEMLTEQVKILHLKGNNKLEKFVNENENSFY